MKGRRPRRITRRSSYSTFQGGGHGIEIRQEGSEEFLYVCGYQGVKAFAKMTPEGEIVWFRKAPMESGAYAAGEDTSTKPSWNRQGFLPTNFAFLDDGGFLLADGYGTFKIHRYDKDAKWVTSFGGAGGGKGTFDTPHGIWIDRRAVERLDEINNLRSLPDQWKDGEFVHLHDACFTPTGDMFVAEWVATGRITKLERMA